MPSRFREHPLQFISQENEMNLRRPSRITLLILALFLCFGGIALAQDDLTLESLRDRLVELEESISGFGVRLSDIESLLADPWSPDVLYTDDGICQSPMHASSEWSSRINPRVHQETADAFRSTYGVSIDPYDVEMASISMAVGSSTVYLEYSISGQKVVEKWSHCDYQGHSEWTEDN